MFALGMGVRDIFKSRQLSSQSFFQKNFKAIVKSIVRPEIFFKAIVKSILFSKTLSRQLSSQLCYQKILKGNCQVKYLVKFYLIIYVNYCHF